MAKPFTRLSVVSGQRQLDISLPADRPVAELLVDLLTQLDMPPGRPPSSWALSNPRYGAIVPAQTLAEIGVLDGDVLYLSPTVEAAKPPQIEDVLDAVTAAVDAESKPWRDAYRDTIIASMSAAVVIALTAALATMPNRPLGGLLLAALFAAVIVTFRSLRRQGGGGTFGWACLAAAPLAVLLLTAGADLDTRLIAATAGALIGIAIYGYTVHRSLVLLVAGLAAGLIASGVAGITATGVSGVAIAAWGSPLVVLALWLLPPMALTTSGIVRLVERSEAGEELQHAQVERAIKLGRSTVDGLVIAVAIVAIATTVTLTMAGPPARVALGELLGAIFLLRSRSFTQALHVAFMLAVPVAGLIATVWSLPRWIQATDASARSTIWITGLLLLAMIIVLFGYLRLPAVPAAYVSQLLNRLDTIAVVTLIPLVLLAQNIFGWIANL